jgi:hypothetical protein
MTKNKKIILLFLSVAAVLGAVVVTVILLRANNEQKNENINYESEFQFISDVIKIDESELLPTNNWEIYRDEVYGLEFKYPKEWETDNKWHYENSRPELYFSSSGTIDNLYYGDRKTPWSRISFSILERESNQDVLNTLEKITNNTLPGPGFNACFQYVKIKNSENIIGNCDLLSDNEKHIYFGLANDKILEIYFVSVGSDENLSKVFFTMVDSVKIRAIVDSDIVQ